MIGVPRTRISGNLSAVSLISLMIIYQRFNYRVDEGRGALARWWLKEWNSRSLGDGITKVLNSLDDCQYIIVIIEVGRSGHDRLQLAVDCQTATRDCASSKILSKGHRSCRLRRSITDIHILLKNEKKLNSLLLDPSTLACQCRWRLTPSAPVIISQNCVSC